MDNSPEDDDTEDAEPRRLVGEQQMVDVPWPPKDDEEPSEDP